MLIPLAIAARWKYRTPKIAKKSPPGHHRTTLSGYIFATKARIHNRKNVTQQWLPRCPHNMVNISPIAAEICWRVWGTPAKFQRFRVLPALLQRRHSPEANQTLHDVWLLPGLVDYIYIFGCRCPVTEFCHVGVVIIFLAISSSFSNSGNTSWSKFFCWFLWVPNLAENIVPSLYSCHNSSWRYISLLQVPFWSVEINDPDQ